MAHKDGQYNHSAKQAAVEDKRSRSVRVGPSGTPQTPSFAVRDYATALMLIGSGANAVPVSPLRVCID